MNKQLLTIQVTTGQTKQLDNAWKKTECMNRSEFIRKAINAYANETIFPEGFE
ncbi:ribbon-helix-helix protein, CopG family [Methanocorpusculum sp.]